MWAGCALLAACGAALIAAGAGVWLLTQRRAEASEPAVEYILDATPRMALLSTGGERSRIEVARSVLGEIIRPADPDVTAGLRAFGMGSLTDACQDTKLVVPLGLANQAQIAAQLPELETGPTAAAPLAQAILSAIRDVATTKGPHTLVVVTGGADSCNPEAGQAVAAEAESAGIDVHVFVIGYQVLPEEAQAIKSLVDATGRGTYLEARDEATLRALLEAIQAYIDNPASTTRVDVLATATSAAARQATPTAAALSTATGAAPTAVPTATAGAAYQSQTACDHPYFPLRLGATWTYATASGTLTLRVTEVAGDRNSATATVLRDGAEPLTWHCEAEGLAFYTGRGGLSGSNPEVTGWNLISSSGVWLLPAGQLTAGAQWTFSFTYEEGPERGNPVIGSYDFAQELAVAGFETFNLAGETLEALRVDSTQVLTPKDFPPARGRDTYWFVQGIGLVKTELWREFTNGPETQTFVLKSYHVP